MTTGADLFDLVFQALMPVGDASAPTSAGSRIRRPSDLPTQADDYPVIKLRYLGETKVSQGRASIGFTTTAAIRITGEASAPAQLSDPKTTLVEGLLWQLKAEIERAVINSYPLFRQVQQLASVQTQLAYTAEATHLAGVQMDLSFEFFESAEDFFQLPVDDLEEIVAAVPTYPRAGLTVATS